MKRAYSDIADSLLVSYVSPLMKLSVRHWLSFAFVASHVLSSLATSNSASIQPSPPQPPAESATFVTQQPTPSADNQSPQEQEQVAEAARAYKQALTTLSVITSLPLPQAYDPYLAINFNSKSILSSLLPNFQGQGPVGSAARIILKLYYHIFSWFSSNFGRGGLAFGAKKRDDEVRSKAIKVIDLLQHSAELGNMDALFTLSQISLFPPNQYFQADPKRAYEALSTHVSQTGNATSQSLLAFFHATGYHDVVPVSQSKAQLYYTFAANGDDRGAQMALAYRYWSGIGTLESCERANAWYGRAAEQAMAKFLSGPPGGRTLPPTPTRLSDLVGGVYGPGSSVASTGLNAQKAAIKAGAARAAGETWDDVLEYYLFNADRGEIDFAYRLGKIFYQGSIYAAPGGIASGSEGVGAIPRNYKHARHYFSKIARQVWPQDPPSTIQTKDEQKPTGFAAASCAYLGRMYLRGEGVKIDYTMARLWFERGVEYGDRESHNGLGIIYRDALGVRQDMKKALYHFNAASSQELAEAQVNIGKYYYEHGDMPRAVIYFDNAIRHGSPLEANYYLAEIHSEQASSPNMDPHLASSACTMAVSFYKMVAERGVWDDDLLRDAESAWISGTEQGREVAMLKWWIAAERGSEIAQNNLAYVLDQDTSLLRWLRPSSMAISNDTARLALTQWTRAAGQRNIDALVKVGDYYYHGLGVSDEPESARLEKAVRYYQSAADTQLSALAMWNLGWMYENGVGVPQDFHLAKRHYDLALETNSEAYLPVFLSLMKLYARSIWHTLMGGQGGLNIWTSDDEKEIGKHLVHGVNKPHNIWKELSPQKPGSVGELGDGRQKDVSTESGREEDHLYQDDESDGPWYFGKAKEEFHRRHNARTPRRAGDDEDPIQWARERRNEERDRESDFGPEDYFDGAMRGNREDEEIDEFAETMLLVLLCLVISVLLYIRTRIVDRMRRDQREQQNNGQQNNGNGGVFPGVDDPARNEWAILR